MTNYRITTPTAIADIVTDQIAPTEEQAISLHYRDLYAKHGGDVRTTGPATVRLIREAEAVPA